MKIPKPVVLFVEDEFLQREELVTPLEDAGFFVLSETRGSAAIKTFAAKAPEFVALITDVNLSDIISGWEVARQAREINPELPVIYTTSYDCKAWAANGVPNSVHIQKPFVPQQVIGALIEQLKAPASLGVE